jgi:protein-S-isoprenylcysteine O-methyltransferase Ste14
LSSPVSYGPDRANARFKQWGPQLTEDSGAGRPPRTAGDDIPGIICPGPVLAFAPLILGLILDWLWPLGLMGSVVRVLRIGVALILALLGAWLLWSGGVVFRGVGTDYLPWKPSRTLATVGVYSRTRNPMYQGFFVLALAAAVVLKSDWTIVLLVPAALVLHQGVVLREERYLQRKFGDAYAAFAADVPRYGLPFAPTRRTAAMLMLLPVLLIAALAAAVWPRETVWRFDRGEIAHWEKNMFAWVPGRPTLYPLALIITDDSDNSASSDLRLFEDGHLLGPAHSATHVIANIGHGAYAHRRLNIRFSTSDNSDPRSNGRTYEARTTIRPAPLPLGATIAFIVALSAIMLIHVQRRIARQAASRAGHH